MKKMYRIIFMLMACTLASCGGGDGGGTNPPVTLNPPLNLTAVAGNGLASVSWDASAGAETYNLYWATAPGVTKGTGTKIQGVTSPYLHTGLANGMTYYYAVAAQKDGLESDLSTEVSATPFLAPPPPPLN